MTNPKKYFAENKHFVGYLLLKILRKKRERERGGRENKRVRNREKREKNRKRKRVLKQKCLKI